MNKQLIGVLGPRGSYTEQAALLYFGDCLINDGFLSPQGVIEAVLSRVVNYGVVPVENSINGGVPSTLDSLLKYDVFVIGELVLPVHHLLACHPKAECFSRVVSHEQALEQCRDYLRLNYPGCFLEPSASTSHAAREVASKCLLDSLVICNEHAANAYGLRVIADNIATSNNNETRFLVIGSELAKPSGSDKTSIVFGLIDRPGALYDALHVFKKYNINLTRIESRPTKKRLGDYLFFVDFDGYYLDEVVVRVLGELSGMTSFIKSFGSYKKFKSNEAVIE